MKDTLKIEGVLFAFRDYMEAAADEREAYSRYDGMSWDYHGDYYIGKVTEAAARAQEVLDAYIDARIAAAHPTQGE